MKVTTELKNLIKAEFEKKKEEAKNDEKIQSEQEYQRELESFKNSEVYKNYISAFSDLKDYLKPFIEKYEYGNDEAFYYNNPYSVDAESIVKFNRYYRSSNISNKLDTERDKLLIKLTYEKDFDKVQALLKEYGIKL